MKLVEVIWTKCKKCGAKLGKGGRDHRFGICDKHVNEALDDYDRALHKALLLVSEHFHDCTASAQDLCKFSRNPQYGKGYVAVSPDGRVRVEVSLSGMNVRIDVYFNRADYVKAGESIRDLSEIIKALDKKLQSLKDPRERTNNEQIIHTSEFQPGYDRRYTRLVGVSNFLKPYSG